MEKKLKKVKLYSLNEAYNKVLNWFFAYPNREIGLSDLSEALSISKTTSHRIVNQLVEEKFLNLEIIGKLWRITCNQQHNYNLTRKVGHNLILIYNSPIISIIHEHLKQVPRVIILFGSYRKGDDTDKSDIDIAVEIAGEKELEIVPLGILPEFGYRKDVQINLHIFSRNKININLFSNIANGIVLDGFLEVRP